MSAKCSRLLLSLAAGWTTGASGISQLGAAPQPHRPAQSQRFALQVPKSSEQLVCIASIALQQCPHTAGISSHEGQLCCQCCLMWPGVPGQLSSKAGAFALQLSPDVESTLTRVVNNCVLCCRKGQALRDTDRHPQATTSC